MKAISSGLIGMAVALMTAAAPASASVPAAVAIGAGELRAPRTEGAGEVMRLVAPEAAVPLTAGSSAALEWVPLPGLAGLRAREEWEAFLSLDGGRSFTVRITPHLDSDLRRVVWTVPDAPSRDARILMRFGDERHETVFELPERFVIAAPAAGAPLSDLARAPVAAAARGEAPRPGEAGVVAWAEGSRRGTGQRQVAFRLAGMQDGRGQPAALAQGLASASAEAPSPAPLAALRQLSARALIPPRGAAPDASRAAPPALDRLLQTARRNE